MKDKVETATIGAGSAIFRIACLNDALDTKELSVVKIADKSFDSMNQALRYIRLTNLITQLLDKVDERKLSFIPTVELSYLKKQE